MESDFHTDDEQSDAADSCYTLEDWVQLMSGDSNSEQDCTSNASAKSRLKRNDAGAVSDGKRRSSTWFNRLVKALPRSGASSKRKGTQVNNTTKKELTPEHAHSIKLLTLSVRKQETLLSDLECLSKAYGITTQTHITTLYSSAGIELSLEAEICDYHFPVTLCFERK